MSLEETAPHSTVRALLVTSYCESPIATSRKAPTFEDFVRSVQLHWPRYADRLSVLEEDHETVPGTELQSRYRDTGTVRSGLEQAEAYAAFVFSAWVRLPELLALAGMVLSALWLLIEAAVELVRGGELA